MSLLGLLCLQGLPQRVKNDANEMPALAGISLLLAGQFPVSLIAFVDCCRCDPSKGNRLRLCKRPYCASVALRGPPYKPHERAPFENRRRTATLIERARLDARQQNSRAFLSFGLTSSCYRVEQRIVNRSVVSLID
jgi:hypothetical protein